MEEKKSEVKGKRERIRENKGKRNVLIRLHRTLCLKSVEVGDRVGHAI